MENVCKRRREKGNEKRRATFYSWAPVVFRDFQPKPSSSYSTFILRKLWTKTFVITTSRKLINHVWRRTTVENYFWFLFLLILANFFLFTRLPLALFSESRYISITFRFASKQKTKDFDGVIGSICLPISALTLADAVPNRHHHVWVFYARFIKLFLVFGSFIFVSEVFLPCRTQITVHDR